MSSRGRGYGGRGGSRGGGYRGSYRGSNRGYYDNRGGRGGYSSHNSDSRYHGGGGAPRYTNTRDRIDDSYKKSYRTESSSYSNRDYVGRSGSPDRKRMRMEGSSSDRRSHDGGSHYGGSYGGRQDSYVSERRSYISDERRRSPAREYRKPGGMGPPREPRMTSGRSRAPRRSFRGRTLRSRASYRGGMRSRGSFTSRRFPDKSFGYTRAFRSIKSRSSVKSKDDEASSTEEDWDAEDKEEDEVEDETQESKEKSPKVTEEPSEGEGGADTDKDGGEGSDTAPTTRPRALPSLVCVHCKDKCAGYGMYAKHLLMSKHRAAMSAVARRHKSQLLRMRVAQRAAQRELESAAGAALAPRTTFCLVCRLNHRTTRHAHNLTDTHLAMKRFLMPFCRICRLTFRSPMIYEHHICSIEHLKKKATQSARRASPKAEASGDEGMDVDLDNFMTLDSVGDVDEVEDEDSGTEKKEEDAAKKPKVEINIGSEHIKKLEVWYCELCRVYVGRVGAEEGAGGEALRRHCRLRAHLRRYVEHRDTRTLRRHAERIHRQLHQRKEEEKEKTGGADDKMKTDKTDSDDGKKKLENGTDANASGNDDKLWEDVDKDIGDLLREVNPQGNEASDDEDDLNRYDKFRKSDKKNKDGEELEITIENNIEQNGAEVQQDADDLNGLSQATTSSKQNSRNKRTSPSVPSTLNRTNMRGDSGINGTSCKFRRSQHLQADS